MNYGGGGLIESSGEKWVLSEVVSKACQGIDSPVLFDVGANVGDYSLCLREHVPAAIIYAFEPAETVYQELAKRIDVVDADRQIKPYKMGFSDSTKVVELFSYTVEGEDASVLSSIDQRLPTQVLDVRTCRSEQVRVETIDSFCEAKRIDRVDFLKLDVEGHELSVLRGAQRMLTAGLISMIQFEFGPANIYSRTYFYDFWSLLSNMYDIYRIIPKGIAPISHYGEHLEIFLTTNYLALRRDFASPKWRK